MKAEVTSLPPPSRPPGDFPLLIAIRTPKGCPDCGFTGYRGRTAIHETLTIDPSIAGSIASGAPVDSVVRAGQRYGMRTLWQAGLRRVWTGETSYDEVARAVGEPALEIEPSAPRPAATAPTRAPAPTQAPVRAPGKPVPPRVPEPKPTPVPAAPEVRAAASAPAETTRETAEAPAAPAKPPLVLIADDDPAMRALISTILKPQGFEVAEAVDGLEALDQAQRLAPAILLLDMDMPRLDGFGVLEALRRRLAGRAVPVVVVTVHDDPATETRCIELGAEDYLTKPIQPSSLVVRVRAVLRRAGVHYAWPKS